MDPFREFDELDDPLAGLYDEFEALDEAPEREPGRQGSLLEAALGRPSDTSDLDPWEEYELTFGELEIEPPAGAVKEPPAVPQGILGPVAAAIDQVSRVMPEQAPPMAPEAMQQGAEEAFAGFSPGPPPPIGRQEGPGGQPLIAAMQAAQGAGMLPPQQAMEPPPPPEGKGIPSALLSSMRVAQEMGLVPVPEELQVAPPPEPPGIGATLEAVANVPRGMLRGQLGTAAALTGAAEMGLRSLADPAVTGMGTGMLPYLPGAEVPADALAQLAAGAQKVAEGLGRPQDEGSLANVGVLAQAVYENVPNLVGGVGAGVLGGPAGAFGFMASLEAGAQYNALNQVPDIDEHSKRAIATGVGFVNGALEQIPLGWVRRALGQGGKEVLRRNLASAMARQGTREGATEAMQELVSWAGELEGFRQSGGLTFEIFAQKLAELPERVKESFVVGAVLGGVTGGAIRPAEGVEPLSRERMDEMIEQGQAEAEGRAPELPPAQSEDAELEQFLATKGLTRQAFNALPVEEQANLWTEWNQQQGAQPPVPIEQPQPPEAPAAAPVEPEPQPKPPPAEPGAQEGETPTAPQEPPPAAVAPAGPAKVEPSQPPPEPPAVPEEGRRPPSKFAAAFAKKFEGSHLQNEFAWSLADNFEGAKAGEVDMAEVERELDDFIRESSGRSAKSDEWSWHPGFGAGPGRIGDLPVMFDRPDAPEAQRFRREMLELLESTYAEQETSAAPSPEKPEPEAAPEAPPAAATAIPEDRPTGATGKAVTGTDEEFDFTYRLVELEDLALKPLRDELQPRNRSRKASEDQIRQIVEKPDPLRLLDNRIGATGAPVVTTGGEVYAGYGRLEAFRRLYEQAKAGNETAQGFFERYREAIGERSEALGIDAEDLSALSRPVLVRAVPQVTDAAAERAFVQSLNKGEVAEMSATEQALADAARITPEMLEGLTPGETGQITLSNSGDFIRRFMHEFVSTTEEGAFVDSEGVLSKRGHERVKNAVLAYVYRDAETVEKIVESVDDTTKRLGTAMLEAAPRIARMQQGIGLGELLEDADIAPDIVQAVAKLRELRAKNQATPKGIETYLTQQPIGEPELTDFQRELLGLFGNAPSVVDRYKKADKAWKPVAGSAKRIAQVLKRYVALVEARPVGQFSIFQEDVSPMELFQEAVATYEAQPDLFAGEDLGGDIKIDAQPKVDRGDPRWHWLYALEPHPDLDPDVKRLWRQMARKMHPDLGNGTPEDLSRRTEFMAAANNAADANNLNRLREIDEAWERGDEHPPEFGRRRGRPGPQGRGYQPRRPQPRPRPRPRGRADIPSPPEYGPAQRSVDTEPGKIALEMPDMVELAEELEIALKVKPLIRGRPGIRGSFNPREFLIQLKAAIAEDPAGALRTLAHEIGHAIDYLPEGTFARGRILGHMAVLKGYTNTMLDEAIADPSKVLTDAERRTLYNQAARTARRHVASLLNKRRVPREYANNVKEWQGYYYQKLLREEMWARGLVDEKTVKDELWQVSAIMRPIPVNATPEWLSYRAQNVELYADFFSALITEPAMLKEKAPTAHSLFFNYLERKPEVAAHYMAMQRLAGANRLEKLEHWHQRAMRAEADGASGLAHAMKDRKKTHFGESLVDGLIDKNSENYKRVRRLRKEGKRIPASINPLYFLEEMAYQNSAAYVRVQDIHTLVLGPLRAVGISPDLFNSIIRLRRSATERAELFNPGGFSGATADELMRYQVEHKLTDTQREVLEDALRNWWQIRLSIIDEIAESGMFSRDLIEKMYENPDYVHFKPLHWLEQQLGGEKVMGGAWIHKQFGTLSDIADPFAMTLLKDMALLRAAHRTQAARAMHRFYATFFPEDIRVLPKFPRLVWGAKGKTRGLKADEGILSYVQNGKVVEVALPRRTIREFETAPYSGVYEGAMKVQRIFRRFLIDWNPAWAVANIVRDMRAFAKQVVRGDPVTAAAKSAYYAASVLLPNARAIVFPRIPGLKRFAQPLPNELRALYEGRAMIQTGQRVYEALEQDAGDNHLAILAHFGVIDPFVKGWKGKLAALDRAVSSFGEMLEKNTKAAAYKYLKANQEKLGLTDRDIMYEVRNRAGTPGFMRRGTWHRLTNTVFLFSNVAKEGWRSAAEVARERPAEYALKTLVYDGLPILWAVLAKEGWLDKALGRDPEDDESIQAMYRDISDYQLKNNDTFPLAKIGGKTLYLSFPRDHVGQVVRAVLWSVLTDTQHPSRDKMMTELAFVALEHVPWGIQQTHPLLEDGSDIIQVATGGTPWNHYVGAPRLRPEDVADRGALKLVRLYGRFMSETLLRGFWRRPYVAPGHERAFDAGTALEHVLESPVAGTILGRFVKLSDYGRLEEARNKERRAQRDQDVEQAKRRELIYHAIDEVGIDPFTNNRLDKAKLEAIWPKVRTMLRQHNKDVGPEAAVKLWERPSDWRYGVGIQILRSTEHVHVDDVAAFSARTKRKKEIFEETFGYPPDEHWRR